MRITAMHETLQLACVHACGSRACMHARMFMHYTSAHQQKYSVEASSSNASAMACTTALARWGSSPYDVHDSSGSRLRCGVLSAEATRARFAWTMHWPASHVRARHEQKRSRGRAGKRAHLADAAAAPHVLGGAQPVAGARQAGLPQSLQLPCLQRHGALGAAPRWWSDSHSCVCWCCVGDVCSRKWFRWRQAWSIKHSNGSYGVPGGCDCIAN